MAASSAGIPPMTPKPPSMPPTSLPELTLLPWSPARPPAIAPALPDPLDGSAPMPPTPVSPATAPPVPANSLLMPPSPPPNSPPAPASPSMDMVYLMRHAPDYHILDAN